eukprot:NODE_872_length_1140_cov_305.366239_g830_i0.p1 GENE.NODE_872_length_1140_cov_305.366239_g830_i0~~NODE_872_length_1140_cov_305.366239_g830_i0.p1  ORF type:complete len:306 (-),score=2.10 NODE_872_length_1140_cov_305.366239_g830_i0:142-1059(-)
MDLKIGSHCALPGCRQLDFLPFTCDGCGKTYCLDHRMQAQHECSARTRDALTCELCQQVVPLRRGEDPNKVMDSHISGGCKARKVVPDAPKCPVKGCKVKHNYVPITCPRCSAVVCVHHRTPEDHSCPNAPKPVPRQMFRSRPTTAPQSTKELGPPNVPQDEKFHFNIWVPTSIRTNACPQHVWASKRWGVGKFVDWLCKQWNLRITASYRYRLVCTSTLELIPNNFCIGDSGRLRDDGSRQPDLSAGCLLLPEAWITSPTVQSLATQLLSKSGHGASRAPDACAREVMRAVDAISPQLPLCASA